jgi:hypothetical protein
VKPQTTAAARIHGKPNGGKIYHSDKKTSTITRIRENPFRVNLMHNLTAAVRRWWKHK